MIDTHTHLYMPEYNVEGQPEGSFDGQCAAVDRAVEAGVSMMILPNVDTASIQPIKTLHALRPDVTAMAMGLHPTEVKESWRDDLALIMAEIDRDRDSFVAIGEAGVDLYWDKTMAEAQMQAFDEQLSHASRLGLPVIIHSRDALPQTLEVLKDHPGVSAVFHSFGGTPDDVEAIRSVGDYYFGINGIVTFKNSGLRSTLPHIPADRLLTETDAPFLAPVPLRGKRNESALIIHVRDTVADALGIAPDSLDRITTDNAKRLFHI